MLTEEQLANAYAEATDGDRRLVQATRDTARHWRRIKPDPETNPLAELDSKKEPTWHENMPLATPLRASTCAR